MDQARKKILNFWESQGLSRPPASLVTHRDFNQVSIEINLVLNILKRNDKLLDIGCGNGYATSIYARKCKKTVGIDYSKNMINAACKAYADNKRLTFNVNDVLALNYKRGEFTVISSTRCLINLTSWQEQKQAIVNMHKMLNRGGRLILLEGMREGRQNLNLLRKQLGLSVMPSVWHNLDLDESKLFPLLKKKFKIKSCCSLGFYDVLVRAFYPASVYPKAPKYGSRYQAAAERLFYALGDDIGNKYSREMCLELVKK